jgi:hypothetical protein
MPGKTLFQRLLVSYALAAGSGYPHDTRTPG